jgi:hypothetical protein
MLSSLKTIESTASQVYRELVLFHGAAPPPYQADEATQQLSVTNLNKRRKLEHRPLMAQSSPTAPLASSSDQEQQQEKGHDKGNDRMDLELHEDVLTERNDIHDGDEDHREELEDDEEEELASSAV